MTPAARIEAAIDLLARIDALDQPAERQARAYFRERRYIGSKDRRAVSDLLYGVLRHRARLDWWVARAAPGAAGVRGRVIAYHVLSGTQDANGLVALFDGEGYHPAPLGEAERQLAEALAGQGPDHPEQPDWVRYELPEWLLPRLQETFGGNLESELAALNREAPLDLRVNSLKSDRPGALAALAAEGLEAAPTPLSPLGLRVAGRKVLPNLAAFRDGLVEVQDEGAQLVALLTDARPGMAVADLCAGAGGKTLALAAAMAGEGRLAALDRDTRRLDRARPRLARAGVFTVELRGLAGHDEPWWDENEAAFERVLVDAPCSGSGAWRRHPDARWQLTEARLARDLRTQAGLLDQAAALVAPGGRLVYATCSLLPEENQHQIAGFLERHPDFAQMPVPQVWSEALGTDCPAEGLALLLTPARHGTDGFFLAVLARPPAP